MIPKSLCAAAFCVASSAPIVWAQDTAERCTQDAMLVFDGSGSMAETGFNGLDQPRIVEARLALRTILPQITPFRNLGLITYGPGPEEICTNVHLNLPPTPNSGAQIVTEVERLKPEGNTPLTDAVQMAAEVLNHRNKPGVIVLVTDGKETCGGQTCQVAADLNAQGVDLTIHVIGFQVRSDRFDWSSAETGTVDNGKTTARCLADRTGGVYASAETLDQLVDALRETLACPLYGFNNTTATRKPS